MRMRWAPTCCKARRRCRSTGPRGSARLDDPAKSKVIGKIEFTTLPARSKPGQAEIGNWLIAIPRAFAKHRSRDGFPAMGHHCRTDETIRVARQSTDAQIAVSRSGTGGEVSRVPGAVAFARNFASATAHAAVERDRKRLWHLSLEGQQRRVVSRGCNEPGECRDREDSPARSVGANCCCLTSSSLRRWWCFSRFRFIRCSTRSRSACNRRPRRCVWRLGNFKRLASDGFFLTAMVQRLFMRSRR